MTSVLMKIRMLLQYCEDIQPNFLAFGRRLLAQISSSVSWDPQPNEGMLMCLESLSNRLNLELYFTPVLTMYIFACFIQFFLFLTTGHKDKLLRNVILDLLYAFEDESTITEAHKRFEAHKNGTAPLWSDIRATVYKTVLRNADAATYDTFLKVYISCALRILVHYRILKSSLMSLNFYSYFCLS